MAAKRLGAARGHGQRGNVPVCAEPERLEHVAAEEGDRKRCLVEPDLAGELVDQGDDRRPAHPARRQERAGVDLVDDDVEGSPTVTGPESSRLAVDAEPAAASHDLDAADDLALRAVRDRGGEQRDRVPAGDERARYLLRQYLRASCRWVGEVLPVEQEDTHRSATRNEVRKRSRAWPRLELLGREPGDSRRPLLAWRDEVADVHGVVEEQVSVGGKAWRPVLEVGAYADLAMVAIDEEEVHGLLGRLRGPRVGDVKAHVLRQAVALERVAELAVEVGARPSLPRLDVIGVDDAVLQRRRQEQGAPAAVAADLHDRPCPGLPHESVEERGLVQPQRGDAVGEHRAGEQEREVLEAGQPLGPALDVREGGAAPLPVGDHYLGQQAADDSGNGQTLRQPWSHAPHGTADPRWSRS